MQKNAPGAEKKRNPPTQYWKALVKVWFDAYAELLPKDPEDGSDAIPCFDTIETAQMKNIMRELKKRAEQKNIEWTEKTACERFKAFLLKAWEDDFCSKNFMLRIISSCKTKLFNNQVTPKRNGNIGSASFSKLPNPGIKSSRDFGDL